MVPLAIPFVVMSGLSVMERYGCVAFTVRVP
jgi:hypothetical protein